MSSKQVTAIEEVSKTGDGAHDPALEPSGPTRQVVSAIAIFHQLSRPKIHSPCANCCILTTSNADGTLPTLI